MTVIVPFTHAHAFTHCRTLAPTYNHQKRCVVQRLPQTHFDTWAGKERTKPAIVRQTEQLNNIQNKAAKLDRTSFVWSAKIISNTNL